MLSSILAILIVLFLIGLVCALFKYLLIAAGSILAIYVVIHFSPMSLYIIGAIGFISLLYTAIRNIVSFVRKKKYEKALLRWAINSTPKIASSQGYPILLELSEKMKQGDKNAQDYQFVAENIPWGRANAFLQYFNHSIFDTEVYYFSPVCGKNENELREYGVILTDRGLYFSWQEKETNAATKGTYRIRTKEISFVGLRSCARNEKEMVAQSVSITSNKTVQEKNVFVDASNCTVAVSTLYSVCNRIVTSELGLAMLKDTLRSGEQTHSDVSKHTDIKNAEQTVVNAASWTANSLLREQHREVKNYMAGRQGSGYAAEYGNNTVDRLLGKDVVNAAQQLDPTTGRQVKNGADRNVNGIEIQTKYYQTGKESVSAAFQNDTAKYIKQDGTMMVIEVPRDQYHEALLEMKKRIDNGQVPGAKAGDDPRQYVQKGFWSYGSARNIALAGTIEGLSVDVMSGVVAVQPIAGITAVLTFASAVWKGASVKEATQASMSAVFHLIGRSVFMQVMAMQLTRAKIALPTINTNELITIQNPIYHISETMANNISATVGKTKLGEALTLSQLDGEPFPQK